MKLGVSLLFRQALTTMVLKAMGWKSQATKSEASQLNLHLCVPSHMTHPDVACSGLLTCGPQGDVHSLLSLGSFGTRKGQILCFLMEMWAAS